MLRVMKSLYRPLPSIWRSAFARTITLSPLNYQTISENRETWSDPLNFVDGNRVDPCSQDESGSFPVIEPASGKILCKAKSSGKEEVDRAVRAAREAFDGWSERSGLERGKVLRQVAGIIRDRLEDIATVETRDSGLTSIIFFKN